MPKPNHKPLNSLIDPDKTLDQIFEEGKKRCMAQNAENGEDGLTSNEKKESKAEKKQRIKME